MPTDAQYQDLLQRHTHAVFDWTAVVPDDWHQELPVEPLVPRYFRNTDDDFFPVLLTLEELSDTQMRRLGENLEEAARRPYMLIPACLLYVDPDVHSKALVHHLTDKLMLEGPGRKKAGDRLIRYYYGGIFLHLLRILPPPRVRQLFGPVLKWSIPFQKEWISFMPPQTTEVIPRFWTTTDEEQSQRIERIGILNDVLKSWRERTGHRWDSVDALHADADKLERLLLSGVTRYRIRVYEDQFLFGLHSLLYGEDFHEHPKIRQIMQTVQKEGWGYAGGCMEITEEGWEEIVAAQHDQATIEQIHQRKKYHASRMR